MTTLKLATLAAVTAAALALAHAETIVCNGILGNSGEQGDALVRFGNAGARGMGVAYDKFGSLWDRGGDGVLNRYAADGRLLAQYRIPGGSDGNDQLALVGDTIVLRIRGGLYTLPIDAPAGSEAVPMQRKAGCISFGSANGCLAAADGDAIWLINPATGEATQAATLGGAQCLDLAPDGTIYALADWRLRKIVNGKEVTGGWPKGSPGERPQLVDGFWFGHGWHGTIRRFSADAEPSPGVVLGGASGSFIGHLDENSELTNGRGMAKLRDDLYAVSGMGGVMHLLQWDDSRRQMTIIRRVGSVPGCRGLGLDRNGNVWFHAGAWKWTDAPDSPLLLGVNAPEGSGISQAVMLDGDSMVATGFLWGKPTFYFGKLDREVAGRRIETPCALKRGNVGSAACKRDGQLVLLQIDAAGTGVSFKIGSDGSYRGEGGPVALKTAAQTADWTTLAMKDDSTLLAAAGGSVIEFAPHGADWKETGRWSSWGEKAGTQGREDARTDGGDNAVDRFGARIFICSDAGRLWVSDRERHRVLVFDPGTRRLLASFGTADKPGDTLAGLSSPETIIARGNRAVVFDSANQRLVKLTIR